MVAQHLIMDNNNFGTQIGDQATFKEPVTINNNTLYTKPIVCFNSITFKKILGSLVDQYNEGDIKLPKEFVNKRNMEEKNIINKIDETYYKKTILRDLKDNFSDIDLFLENIRNGALSRKYDLLAKQLTGNYIANKKKFNGIHEHIQSIINEFLNSLTINDNEDIGDYIAIILHHMYWNCDYGEEVE